jgi:hypothetical protein
MANQQQVTAMAGNKTHEQQLRILEGKDDVPKEREVEDAASRDATRSRTPHDRDARHSEMAVSRGGMHQESRDHNKHNNPGQSGHKPQKHSPAEEKQ